MQAAQVQAAVGTYALLGWFGLYLGVAAALRAWGRTRGLSRAHRAHIAESFVSGVQGVACGVVGVLTVAACWHDVMRDEYPPAVYYSSIGTAYFLYDLWAMYRSQSARAPSGSVGAALLAYVRKDFLMIIHHLTIVGALFPAMVYHSRMGHFFIGCFFCTELSTPFVNARVILSRLGHKNSTVYVVNGILMMTVFAMCRVAMFPVMYAVYLSQQTQATSHTHALATIPVTCHLSCLLVLAPQLYWFSMMVKGAVAVMKTSPQLSKDY